MATAINEAAARGPKPISADGYERLLAYAACILFACALAAIARGHAEWSKVPPLVWAHLLTILFATGLTPIMLLRRRGDRTHKRLGRIWVVAMFGTALITLGVRVTNPGHFSLIHILSVWTIIQAPIIWWSAATHRLAKHRASVRRMVTGALIIAGFFTFPFHRLLGHWLFG